MKGTCKHCGKDWKNLGAHIKNCKAKKQSECSVGNKEEFLNRNDDFQRIENKDFDQSIIPKMDEVINEHYNKSVEEQAAGFFASLPEYVLKPPKKQSRVKSWLGSTQTEILPCVFVDDDSDPVIAYIPYNIKDRVLHNPDTGGIYPFPVKGNIGFFHKKTFLPLVNCPPVDKKYDIPQHHALSLYNMGLTEGQLSAYDELIAEFRQMKIVAVLSVIAAIVTLVACVLVVKEIMSGLDVIHAEFETIKTAYGL